MGWCLILLTGSQTKCCSCKYIAMRFHDYAMTKKTNCWGGPKVSVSRSFEFHLLDKDEYFKQATILFIILLILEFIFIISIGYFGIILGHKHNNKKFLNSVLYGFSGFFAANFVTLLLIVFLSLFNDKIFQWIARWCILVM